VYNWALLCRSFFSAQGASGHGRIFPIFEHSDFLHEPSTSAVRREAEVISVSARRTYKAHLLFKSGISISAKPKPAISLYMFSPFYTSVVKVKFQLLASLILLLFVIPFNAEFGTLASGNLSQAGGGATAQNLSDAINITLGAFNSSPVGNTPFIAESPMLSENSTGGSQQSENKRGRNLMERRSDG